MMRPVLTVTLNPAFDRTVWLDRLVPGETNRAAASDLRIGGKGINVARAVARRGVPTIAIGIGGEDQAGAIERSLRGDNVDACFVRVDGETRTNLKLIERADGRMTEVNETGPVVDEPALRDLAGRLIETVEQDRVAVVVLAGSLPLGVSSAIYADWTRRLAETDAAPAVIVDASDEALALALAARPYLVKPNRAEAEALVGRPVDGPRAALEAARTIVRLGPCSVLLSLGADGAVAAIGDRAEHIPGERLSLGDGRLTSTVGAGDAMVARIAAGLAEDDGDGQALAQSSFIELCRSAVAAASAQIRGGS